MLQSLGILQMNCMELREYVERETMENPMIELTETPRTAAETVGEHRASGTLRDGYAAESAENAIEAVAAPQDEDLYDYLRGQIDLRALTSEVRGAVETVLTGLDRDGYLEESREELSERSGQSVEAIAAAEELVRGLEPAGVGARTLAECLELQLLRRGGDELALAIVREYLPDMAQRRYRHIAEQTGRSAAHVQAACRTIRALSPRPGTFLDAGERPVYILPDLAVTREDERLRVSPIRQTPELALSKQYEELMRSAGQDPEVRRYLREKHRRAVALIQGVRQRTETLNACAERIVAHQQAFFDGGALHPLTMAQIAEETGLHESTVSRAVRGKYLQCERGVYPLGCFFTRALPASESGVSAAAARDAIRELLRKENRKKPLSDRQITEALAADGIVLSRRTVAKYREEMGVPPASGRRE